MKKKLRKFQKFKGKYKYIYCNNKKVLLHLHSLLHQLLHTTLQFLPHFVDERGRLSNEADLLSLSMITSLYMDTHAAVTPLQANLPTEPKKSACER
jgi:hypothetical protein